MAGRIRWRYVRPFLFAAGAVGGVLLAAGTAWAAPGGTTSPTVPPGPAAAPPATVQWIQNHRATTVWADPEGARALAPARQWTYFRIVGPQQKLRLPIFDPRTGAQGWIDALAVGPSGAPAPAEEAAPAPASPPPAPTGPPPASAAPPAAPLRGDPTPPRGDPTPPRGDPTPPRADPPRTDPPPVRVRPAASTLRPAGTPAAPAELAPERWVQVHQATTLWAEREGEAAVASLPQWAFLRWTGPQVGTRIPVHEPRSGATGWLDAPTVGPSGPPPAPLAAPTTAPAAADAAAAVTSPVAVAAPPPAPTVQRAPGVRPGERWIEVDLAQQRLRLIEDERVVHTAGVTTGKAGFATPTGTFRILRRIANETMDSQTTGIARESRDGYLLKDVRYTQYFADDGFALHTNYWQPDGVFGRAPTSHGCIGMRLADALATWEFASHGTVVQIH